MDRIWEFTGEGGHGWLKRIRLAKDCVYGKKGLLGGWIEKESNLGPNAWVSGDAMVSGNAKVCGNAWVSGDAEVRGNARVYGNARVSGDAIVSGDAKVSGNALVYGDAWVRGDARVSGDAKVCGNAWVCGKIKLSSGLCFAYKDKGWDVTEVECDGHTLLIQDYEPVKQTKTITIDGKDIEISKDSYDALKNHFTND